jgi:hypothetical protein
MRIFSWGASTLSKRQRSTEVAFSEKIAKLTPFPSQVAPSGYGYPNQIFTGVIKERVLSATLLELATDETFFEHLKRFSGDALMDRAPRRCGIAQYSLVDRALRRLMLNRGGVAASKLASSDGALDPPCTA